MLSKTVFLLVIVTSIASWQYSIESKLSAQADADVEALVHALNQPKEMPDLPIVYASAVSGNSMILMDLIEGYQFMPANDIMQSAHVEFDLKTSCVADPITISVECHPCCLASRSQQVPIDVLGESPSDRYTSGGFVKIHVGDRSLAVGFKQMGAVGTVSFDQRDLRRNENAWLGRVHQVIERLAELQSEDTTAAPVAEPINRDENQLVVIHQFDPTGRAQLGPVLRSTRSDITQMKRLRRRFADFYQMNSEESAQLVAFEILKVAVSAPELTRHRDEWNSYFLKHESSGRDKNRKSQIAISMVETETDCHRKAEAPPFATSSAQLVTQFDRACPAN